MRLITTMACLSIALLFACFWGCGDFISAISTDEEPENMNARSAQQVSDDLAKAINGELDYAGVFSLLREAERVGSPDLIPQLLEIAKKEAALDHYDLVFRALHTADASGNIREELFAYSQDYKKNAYLARCAILILGREADKEIMQKFAPFNLVKSKGNRIQAAYSQAERVRNLQVEFENLKVPEEKIKLVLDNFLSNWSLIDSVPETLDRCVEDPLAAWSQRHLKQLSKRHPEMAAQAVFARDDYRKEANAEVSLAYRKFLARFLALPSRAEFDKLCRNGIPGTK